MNRNSGKTTEIFALLLAALSASNAFAANSSDPKDVLLQICASLAAADRKASCFDALAKLAGGSTPSNPPSTPAPTPSAHEALLKSFVALGAATGIGTSYNTYYPMVQQAAIELAHFKTRDFALMTANEIEALTKLERALEAYNDAATFWRADIKFYVQRGNDLAYKGGLPLKMVGLEWIADKWDLPLQKSDVWGINQGIKRGPALDILWTIGQRTVAEAMTLLQQKN